MALIKVDFLCGTWNMVESSYQDRTGSRVNLKLRRIREVQKHRN